MMKLDFVVAGFPKCGTTSLCAVLGDHPNICISEIKEPNFFVHYYQRGWTWFETMFQHAKNGQLRGEGSTLYSSGKFAFLACERIAKDCPDVRLIYLVRNPIARAEAAFRELHTIGHFLYGLETPYDFAEAIAERPSIVQNSLYWRNINVYRERFADDQIHVMFLEELAENPARELSKCLEFLSAGSVGDIDNPHRRLNASSTKLYDAKSLRLLRKVRPFRRLWNRLGLEKQNKWGRTLGLRRPFVRPIQWSPELRDTYVEQIIEDTRELLEYCGKPRTFWDLTVRSAVHDATCRRAA